MIAADHRDLVPAGMAPAVRAKMDARRARKTTDGLGRRAPEAEKAHAMRPGTEAPAP